MPVLLTLLSFWLLPVNSGAAEADVPKPPKFVPRGEWGSKPDPIPASRKQTPKWITIHHAGVLWTNSKDPAQFVRDMQSWGKRRPELEKPPRNTYWPDLPYHFLIAPDGRIFEGRPVEYEPESNTNYPLAGNIGVEMMGDFNRQRPSKAQLEACVRLTAWLMQQHKIGFEHVRTHRDAAPGQSNCPGKDFLRYIDDGAFKRWTETVRRGERLVIEPGPPLPGGPSEVITETKPSKEKKDTGKDAVAAGARRGDWSMFCGSPERNPVNRVEKNVPTNWEVHTGNNINWVAQLGANAYGGPVVANGRIYVGTSNTCPRNPKYKGDKGVLLCLRESDGALLWQAVHDKLPTGRDEDWPEIGVTSTPCVDGDRVYYMSNRCELVCLDANGFANGNQGVQDEPHQAGTDADVVWRFDLRKELGVHPHNASASSPVILGDLIYVVTGNGISGVHFGVPNPKAPSFIAVDKATGKLVWKDASPGENIMHGQWGSPAIAWIRGESQVVFPGGDGRVRGFAPKSGRLLWEFDCNPKQAQLQLGGRGTRNDIIAPVVVAEGKIFVGVGQDPEHGEGVGHLWCIDPSRANERNVDLSPVNDNFDPKAPENRFSGLVWHYGGAKENANGGIEHEFRRTLSCCAVADGLCFTADLSGFVHCLDAVTGKRYWKHDVKAAIWSSPLWVNERIYLGDEDGKVTILEASRKLRVLAEIEMGSAIYMPVVAANGVLYVQARDKLYAIAEGAEKTRP